MRDAHDTAAPASIFCRQRMSYPALGHIKEAQLPKLLRIDASSRVSGSHSRDLADEFERAWRARGTGHRVVRRDLVATPIPQIEQTTIAGFYTSPDQMTPQLRAATALSD